MPRLRLIALAVALCLTAVGCGRSGQAAPPSHSSPRPPGGHTEVINMPWQLVSARGRTVRLRWEGGGCLTFDRTQTRETGAQVTITLFVFQYLPGRGEACTADAVIEAATVELRRPLGTRRIAHALPTP